MVAGWIWPGFTCATLANKGKKHPAAAHLRCPLPCATGLYGGWRPRCQSRDRAHTNEHPRLLAEVDRRIDDCARCLVRKTRVIIEAMLAALLDLGDRGRILSDLTVNQFRTLNIYVCCADILVRSRRRGNSLRSRLLFPALYHAQCLLGYLRTWLNGNCRYWARACAEDREKSKVGESVTPGGTILQRSALYMLFSLKPHPIPSVNLSWICSPIAAGGTIRGTPQAELRIETSSARALPLPRSAAGIYLLDSILDVES